jgi:hypothetical protein
MFWKAPSRNGQAIPFEQVMRFLPAFEDRGPDGVIRPFFLLAQHWIEKENDEGETYPAGITCTNFMREEQPAAWEKYKDKKVDAAIEDEACAFCELLDGSVMEDEDGEREWPEFFPQGRWGSDPAWLRRYSHNFAIVLPQGDYAEDDDQIVKVYPAPRSVKDGLYNFTDKKQFLDLFEDEGGWDVEVSRFRKGKGGRGPWQYGITPVEQGQIWYPEWEENLPDLEEMSPNWMTRKEVIEWLGEAHPDVVKETGISSSRKKVSPKSSTRSSRSSSTGSTSRSSKPSKTSTTTRKKSSRKKTARKRTSRT